jgi:glucose-1-phosphate thymidylyltransferase
MNLLIPMAGKGKRMRPHTLNIPKPLITIAGKPIVQRLIEQINDCVNDKIKNIGFVIGDIEENAINLLKNISKQYGAKPYFYTQDEALGTAHAIYCAKKFVKDNTIVAFSDTLFSAKFNIDGQANIIWVKEVENPENFGVVKENDEGYVTDFIEKPSEKVSNKAIIGIYYFKDGNILINEIDQLIKGGHKENNEYQLTNVLENMKNKGLLFRTKVVDEWLDCGNKDATIYANKKILENTGDNSIIEKSANIDQSIIINPCFINENVVIKNSVVGPFVSVENDSVIENCVISNSIIHKNSKLFRINCEHSLIGNFVEVIEKGIEYNIGDYTSIKS